MQLRTVRATGSITIDDCQVDYQQITPQELRDLRIKCSKQHKRGGDPQIDEVAFTVGLFKRQVTGWSNVYGSDGKELECNDANKDLVFAYDQGFVGRVIEEVNLAISERDEVAGKN